MPNAGKSTFVSSISAAKPKVADYPFTTIHPVLGIVKYRNNEMVVADIPGLIEGAHEGKGLGDRFLGHIERCSLLLHLIDSNDENVNKSWETVRKEIKSYSKELNLKSEIIALSKSDTLSNDEMDDKIKDLRNFTGKEVYKISSISGDGVDKILKIMNEKVSEDLSDETIEGWKP